MGVRIGCHTTQRKGFFDMIGESRFGSDHEGLSEYASWSRDTDEERMASIFKESCLRSDDIQEKPSLH